MKPKVYVLHENDEWTVHLEDRLRELNLPYELWHLDEGLLDLSSSPPKESFTIESAPHLTREIIASHLSSAGV